MQSKTKNELIEQAKEFFKQTRYVPSNYDALFHKNHFSSPVTIRKHFGSWENYIDGAFKNAMIYNYENKMFYGGYNRLFRVSLPVTIDPIFTIQGDSYDCLGRLRYSNLEPHEAWVTMDKWERIAYILRDLNIDHEIVPAEKRFLTPFMILEDEYALASFDTPHMEGHYKRTTTVMKYLNENYNLININGVKMNHISNVIERAMN